MEKKQQQKLVEVYAGTTWRSGIVKNLLENEGIQAFIKDEISGALQLPYDYGSMGSVKVMVSETDFRQAKVLIDEFRKTIT